MALICKSGGRECDGCMECMDGGASINNTWEEDDYGVD
jgi:hypothetical protein